jgi:hypothetical protein
VVFSTSAAQKRAEMNFSILAKGKYLNWLGFVITLSKAIADELSPAELLLLDTWETAVSWLVEPDHAREIARRF